VIKYYERSFILRKGLMSEESTSRGERTRSEILEAANRLFIDRGYHGTSMRQIAQQAGISLGGIYNHFSGKEDIFTGVFMEFNPYMDVLPLVNQAQGESLDEIIHDAAQRIVSGFGARTDFLNLMFIELVEFKGEHIPPLFKIVFPELMDFAQRTLTDRPELRHIPPVILIRAFVGLFFSYTITEIIIAEQLPAEGRQGALDYFVDIYLHGILKDGSAWKGS
jgi:AcrR family transcriptional regulator